MDKLFKINEEALWDFIDQKVKDAVQSYIPEQEKTSKKLYTRKETAILLGVTYPTLYRWDIEGKLVAKRISGRVFYTEDTIRNALK